MNRTYQPANHDQFFSISGPLISQYLTESGNSPTRTFTAVMIYKYGEARFNGKTWKFKMNI